MEKRLRDTVHLRKRRHIDVVVSPARQEILTAFGELGPSSVKVAAARLCRSPHSLYPHVRMLVDAGVLGAIGTRRAGRRDETIYALRGSRILVDPKLAGRPARAARRRGVLSLLRLAAREVAAALDAGVADASSGRVAPPRLVVLRAASRMNAAQLADLHALFERVEKSVATARRRPCDGPAFAVTLVLAPMRKRR